MNLPVRTVYLVKVAIFRLSNATPKPRSGFGIEGQQRSEDLPL